YLCKAFELHINQTRGDIATAFHRAHLARYGYAQEKNIVEIVSARVRSIGVVEKLKARRSSTPSSKSFANPHDFAQTYFDRKKLRVAVYRRAEVPVTSQFRAPCILLWLFDNTFVP